MKIQNFPIWKILKTQVQLILNSTRSHGITCLSIKGKIYTKENHARSLFLSGKQRISQSLTGNHALSWLLKMPSIKKKMPSLSTNQRSVILPFIDKSS